VTAGAGGTASCAGSLGVDCIGVLAVCCAGNNSVDFVHNKSHFVCSLIISYHIFVGHYLLIDFLELCIGGVDLVLISLCLAHSLVELYSLEIELADEVLELCIVVVLFSCFNEVFISRVCLNELCKLSCFFNDDVVFHSKNPFLYKLACDCPVISFCDFNINKMSYKSLVAFKLGYYIRVGATDECTIILSFTFNENSLDRSDKL